MKTVENNKIFVFYCSQQIDKHLTTDWKQISKDDAFPGRYYRWPLYKVLSAIQAHKETHHPTMYNEMNAPLNIDIEMDMTGDRPSRMVSNFQKLVLIQHPFEHGQDRSILVFAKEEVSEDTNFNLNSILTYFF